MRFGRACIAVGLAAAAIAGAAQSASAQAPIGPVGDQLRLTQVGDDGNAAFDALDPSIAYNSLQDEFLLVWSGTDPSAPGETEIYGRILDGLGSPKGPVNRLSEASGTEAATQPVVGYSPVVNQYLLAYTAPPPPGANTPAGQREVVGQVITSTGTVSGPVARISNTDVGDVDADQATDPSLAYDSAHDQFRLVWSADQVEGDFEVFTRRVSSSLIDPGGFLVIQVSATAGGTADAPAIAYLPSHDRYAVAWEAIAGDTEIVADIIRSNTVPITENIPVSAAAGSSSALAPSIASNPATGELLVAFIKNDVSGEGPEVFVQRLSADGTQIPDATDLRISTMGPDGNLAYGASTSGTTTTSFHPGLDRYLVTWRADNDLPGLVDNEFERYGQALDAAGNQVELDDFRLSALGADGSSTVGARAGPGAVATSTARRAWLHVFSGDDNRPPLADNEFEIYRRLVGDDQDFDGYTVPADCNDANAGVHPGATDIPDNGVDEDCAGGDAINFDRDGDGSLRPADCDDGNPFIRPGATDIPGNGIDEDCSGADTPILTRAGIEAAFRLYGARTAVARMVVKRAKKGMSIRVRCKGRGCPRGLRRKTKRITVRRSGTQKLTKLFRGARLRPRAVIKVHVIEPSAIGRLARFKTRRAKAPSRRDYCLAPGTTKTMRCPS